MIKKPSIIFFTLMLVLVDQFLKWLIIQYFPDIVIANSGVLFGWIDNVVIGYWLMAIGLLAVIWIIKNADLNITSYRWSLILIIAGGLSNIIDRFIRGYVVDYIDFFDLNHFNLADILIVIGIILYCWQILKSK